MIRGNPFSIGVEFRESHRKCRYWFAVDHCFIEEIFTYYKKCSEMHLSCFQREGREKEARGWRRGNVKVETRYEAHEKKASMN